MGWLSCIAWHSGWAAFDNEHLWPHVQASFPRREQSGFLTVQVDHSMGRIVHEVTEGRIEIQHHCGKMLELDAPFIHFLDYVYNYSGRNGLHEHCSCFEESCAK